MNTITERMRVGLRVAPMLALSLYSLVFLPMVASAQILPWSIRGQGQPAATQSGQFFSALQGGRIYVNNNMGAAILKLSGRQTAGNMLFGLPWGTKVVLAKYEPQTATGVIFVARAIRRPNGQGVIEAAQWRPAYFADYNSDFQVANGANCDSVNPFARFEASGGTLAARGAFTHIRFNAFETAVGMVMQHVHAQVGWVAQASTRITHHKHTSHHLFRKTIHVTENAYSRPVWTLVTPNATGIGNDIGFVAPVPGATVGSISDCKLNNPRTLGKPVAMPAGSATAAGLKLIAGMAFVPESSGNDLPNQEVHTFHHSVTKHGWTMLGSILFSTVIGFTPVVGYLVYKYVLNHPKVSGLANSGGVQTQPGGQPGGVFALAKDVSLSTQKSPYAAVAAAPKGKVSDPPKLPGGVTTFNTAAITRTAYAGGGEPGYTTGGHTGNPLRQSNEWDAYPDVARRVTGGMGASGGGFTVMTQAVLPKIGDMKGKHALSVVREQTSDLLNFNVSPFGQLAPAM